jgi:hypothetical protein
MPQKLESLNPNPKFYQLDIVGQTDHLYHQFHKDPIAFSKFLAYETTSGITIQDHLIASWIVFNTEQNLEESGLSGTVKHLGFRRLRIKGKLELCSVLYTEKKLSSSWTNRDSLNKTLASKMSTVLTDPNGLDLTIYICNKFEIKDYIIRSRNSLNFSDNCHSVDYWKLLNLVDLGYDEYRELLDFFVSNSAFGHLINDKHFNKINTVH